MNKKSQEIMRCQKRKKIHAITYFGGKCCICSYDKCIDALEFHHLKDKKEKPSYIVMRWSWERAKKELEKCILVCSNCHREIHAVSKPVELQDLIFSEKINLEDILEELSQKNLFIKIRNWMAKRCECCKEIFETKNDEQKYCSQRCSQMGQRKVVRPNKEELEELIKDKKIPFVHLGKLYGVSDNAVRKWAKKYGIL